jgi:hypothetical protein
MGSDAKHSLRPLYWAFTRALTFRGPRPRILTRRAIDAQTDGKFVLTPARGDLVVVSKVAIPVARPLCSWPASATRR